MGRIPLQSVRISCHLSKRAGETLEEVSERVGGRQRPIGLLLSLLILKAEPETWQKIINALPAKTYSERTRRDFKRARAERKMKNPGQ